MAEIQREFLYRGKKLSELKQMDIKQLSALLPTRQRRCIKRGLMEKHKPLLAKVKKTREGTYTKPIKTHSRSMIVLPEMVGMMIHVHNGKAFTPIKIIPEMIGRFFGELSTTRSKIQHSAPGIGATKSSTAVASKAK